MGWANRKGGFMSTYVTDRSLESRDSLHDRSSRVLVVVGFDGTAPSERALRSALRLLSGRPGLLEVVYVASPPATVAFSAEAMAEMQAGFDEEQRKLAERAESIIAPHGIEWHFQRRDGSDIAHELLVVAEDLAESGGAESRVGLVVGGSAHRIHRHLNSVPLRLIKRDRFSIVVVP
jgi:nucleotide-binding universal stress UspA family protein